VPTAAAQVAETMAGMHRTAAGTGRLPARKRTATAEILRQILEPIDPDLAGLRHRSPAASRLRRRVPVRRTRRHPVAHLAPCERGLRLTLPHTKGERTGRGVSVAIPYGTTDLCPIRALRAGQDEAGITEGAVFRRIWTPPRGRDGRNTPLPRVGAMAIDAGTVARIIQSRAARAGFDPALLGGHSLKRGALSTGMARGVHPTRLKQLGRHKRSTRCSTSTWNSAIRSKATRSMGCCKQPRTPSLDPALQPRHRAQPSDPGYG
jgi:hypothetical protein